MLRVVVVGTSCSGKTTFSRALSQRLDLPHIELDALYWGPNWTARAPDEFRANVSQATAATAWVCDGNYARVRDLVWERANTLIWLNYSFSIVFYRAVVRTLTRIVTRERLFSGNQESLRLMFDRDWIPWWVLRTFHGRRRRYSALLWSPQFNHLDVMEFTRPREADVLLDDPSRLVSPSN